MTAQPGSARVGFASGNPRSIKILAERAGATGMPISRKVREGKR